MTIERLDELQLELGRLARPYAPSDVAAALHRLGMVVTDQSMLQALEALRRGSTGAGPLEDLLHEDRVSDVVVNGARDVFVDRGAGLERAGVAFVDDEQVRRLAVRLAAAAGRRLDDAQPFVDGRLPDGTRLHAVLSPVASPGTCISLRVPARSRPSLEQLLANDSVSDLGLDLLDAIVVRRVPFLISGGTGAGKTTLLGALLSRVPADERIVVVEDSRELDPNHPHCLSLEGRQPNAEGMGGISLTLLVRQALRMRPDRVVLGEVRGGELVDLLAALNTGHEGGCGTVHANSLADVPARLEALAVLGGLDRAACHAQVASALRVDIHVARARGGARYVAGLGVFRRGPDQLVEVVPAVEFVEGRPVLGPGAEELGRLTGLRLWTETSTIQQPRRMAAA